MSLDKDTVARIARLARLKVAEEELSPMAGELSGIFAWIEQLNEVDTDNVEPMAHPMDQAQRLRADVVTEHNNRENFQAIAPQVEAGLYLVPKVIE